MIKLAFKQSQITDTLSVNVRVQIRTVTSETIYSQSRMQGFRPFLGYFPLGYLFDSSRNLDFARFTFQCEVRKSSILILLSIEKI